MKLISVVLLMLISVMFIACDINPENNDAELVEAMQGTWYEEMHSDLTARTGKKRVFEGNEYQLFYHGTDGHYLVEEGTFKIVDGAFIETATRILDGNAIRYVQAGDYVDFHHPSFYVSGDVLAISSYTGINTTLIGSWDRENEGPYYTLNSDGSKYKAVEYTNYNYTITSSQQDLSYTARYFNQDGSVNRTEDGGTQFSDVTINGFDWTFVKSGGILWYRKSLIIDEGSTNRLLSIYFVKE